MSDLDIREMFLNFMIHPDMQPYCGADLCPYFGSELKGNGHILWEG